GRPVTRPPDFGNASTPGSRNLPDEGSPPTSHTSAPCTCQAIVAAAPSPPAARTTRRRFSATLAAWSAVSAPRLSERYGPSDTPPFRDVNPTSTSARADLPH